MKFENILFPVDFSQRSSTEKVEVEALARRFGSKVTVLHVFEIPAAWYGMAAATPLNMDCFQLFSEAAKESLRNFKLDLPDGSVDYLMLDGDPAWQITNWAGQHKSDLIMMGTHGYGKVQGLLLGSVAQKVMHDAPCPVWSCGSTAAVSVPHAVSDILCPVDLDGETIPLLRFAAEVSQNLGARLHVVHCIAEAETRPNKYFDFDLHRYLLEGARVELTKLQREARTECDVSICSGALSKCIRDVAVQKNIGLIILGKGKCNQTMGRLRTHAFQIIHDAPCSVLSYSPVQLDRTSSSCSAEHPDLFAKIAPLQTGSSRIS